jgi:23S rRNA (guanosine2251-2'-O)-methyltransferase
LKTPSKGQPGNRRRGTDGKGTNHPGSSESGRRDGARPRRTGPGIRQAGPPQRSRGDDATQNQRGSRPPRPTKASAAGIVIKDDLLYGRNAVRESLRAGRRTSKRLFVAEGVREDERVKEILELARQQEVLVERVPRMLLDDLAHGGNHQGIALDAGEYPYADLEDVIERDGTVVVMDHLNDPQNFGTLMRAADASGVAGIVLPQDRSVSVTPAVVNSSAGAIEHLLVAQTPNLARALDKLEDSGRWIVGLDEDEESNSLFDVDIPTPVALVLGAEGSGLAPIVRRRCQVIVSIPMIGKVDSLNAATAGSIVLYDLLRRSARES